MKRYPHFLKPIRAGAQPARIVIVEPASVWGDVPSHPGRRRETLTGWSACLLVRAPGGGYSRIYRDGETVAEWWEALDRPLSKSGTTWVVSWDCARAWTLLGVWEELECGSLDLFGGDYRVRSGGKGAVPGVRMPGNGSCSSDGSVGDGPLPPMPMALAGEDPKADNAARGTPKVFKAGYIVLEDPPLILEARVSTRTGRLKWVDARNWACPAPTPASSPAQRCDRLATFVQTMIAQLESQAWGGLKATAGSQAMHTCRCAYLTHAVHCHAVASALHLERAAYYGGRCEVYRTGEIPGPVCHLDIRSHYPALCAQADVPLGLERVWGPQPPSALRRMMDAGGVIADVEVDADEPWFPVRATVRPDGPPVPVRYWETPPGSIHRGQVIYPIGRFRTALCGPELSLAVDTFRVVRCHAAATYAMGPALAAYSQAMLAAIDQARERGQVDLLAWLKRLAVCLPGKFGQTSAEWVPAPEFLADRPYGEWYPPGPDGHPVRHRAVAWNVSREVVGPDAPDAAPALGAWVTSLGRRKLLAALQAARPGKVYYCDTDSLICDRPAWHYLRAAGLVADGVPGKWRLVGEHAHCHIWGTKYYQLDGAVTRSGPPRGAAMQGPDDGTYWYRQWVAEEVQGRHRPGAEQVLRAWHRGPAYHHRRPGAAGWTYPWRV